MADAVQEDTDVDDVVVDVTDTGRVELDVEGLDADVEELEADPASPSPSGAAALGSESSEGKRMARLASMARTASTEAAAFAGRRRDRRPVRRPAPIAVRTMTTVDLARVDAVRGGTTALTSELLDEAGRSVDRGDIGRALELVAGARRSEVDRLERAELVESARSLAAVADDPDVAALLEAEADRADGARGQLASIRSAVRSAIHHEGALAARGADRAAATAAAVLGAARLALVLIVLGALSAWIGVVDAGEGDALRNLDNYAAVVAWGGIGVVVSMILPFGRDSAGPAAAFLRPSTEMAVRLVLGITCAVAAVVVLQSGVQEVLDLTEAKAYPFAIAAGFSERLLDRRFDPENS